MQKKHSQRILAWSGSRRTKDERQEKLGAHNTAAVSEKTGIKMKRKRRASELKGSGRTIWHYQDVHAEDLRHGKRVQAPICTFLCMSKNKKKRGGDEGTPKWHLHGNKSLKQWKDKKGQWKWGKKEKKRKKKRKRKNEGKKGGDGEHERETEQSNEI